MKDSIKGNKAGLPKFGLLTNPSVDIVKEIKRGSRLGIDYIELGMEPPLGSNDILKKKKKDILRTLNNNNLEVPVAHSAYWGEYGSSYELVRLGWVEETKKQIAVAARFGASKFVIHSRSVGKVTAVRKAKKATLDNYIKSLRALVAFGKAKNIIVMLENDPGNGGSIGQLKDIKYIIDRVPGLGFHLDVGHAFMTAGNKGIKEFIRKIGSRLQHVHIHDNHGEFDEHLPIGKGKIDYKMVVLELKRAGYGSKGANGVNRAGTITLEVFQGGHKGFRSSLKKIRKMWNGG